MSRNYAVAVSRPARLMKPCGLPSIVQHMLLHRNRQQVVRVITSVADVSETSDEFHA